MSNHYVLKCAHGITHGQCRCPAKDKAVRRVPCNCAADADLPTGAGDYLWAWDEAAQTWVRNDAALRGIV